MVDPSRFPDRPLRTNTDLHVLTLPLSISYQLAATPRFHWYAGGTVAVDYLAGTGSQVVLSNLGTGTRPSPDQQAFGRSTNVGYGVQTTFRYLLTPRLGLQLEPALRRYTRGGFPTAIYTNVQFQGGQFAVLFGL